MGFNTTIVIRNDGLEQIRLNPVEFANRLVDAILKQYGENRPVEVPCGHHANVAMVVEQHHADYTHMVLVGGNHATDVGFVGGANHHVLTSQKAMLKRAAENIAAKIKKDKLVNGTVSKKGKLRGSRSRV